MDIFRFSFAVLFTGKWGNFEAEQEVKKQRKAERAVKKQQSEKVKVEKVKVEEEGGGGGGDKTKRKKPSDLLRLWSHESPSKRGGKTVLGREADMLLMFWDQQQRVAPYFTQLCSARKKDEGTSPSLELQRIAEPLLEPQILVGLALGTFLPAVGQSSATLQQASKLVALLFPYYQTRMARCTRMVRGVFREEGLMVGGCLPMGTDLENRARKALASQLHEVQRSLLNPELLPLLLLPQDPAPRRPPLHLPYPSLAALGLALVSVSPISVDQLTSLLRLLFPALRQDSQLEKCLQSVSFIIKPIIDTLAT